MHLISTPGGFAHVYLVRTSAPVYGTTHHVLKRIAVANEAMLTEVKKEVDVMVRSNSPLCDLSFIPPFSEDLEGASKRSPSNRRCITSDV